MQASNIISDDMSLDEKLAAIDSAMKNAQAAHKKSNPSAAPIDPADLTICEGCE